MSIKRYDDMLPPKPLPGHLGYYPVCNKAEWENLPDLYKVMDWFPAKDHRNQNQLKAVKSVTFDVNYMMPYGIGAKVSVHPSDVHTVLFCNHDKPDCLLYSVCGIELEGGTHLYAKWLQDSVSGAFAIYAAGTFVGIQGGFRGYIPERIQKQQDGRFKFNFEVQPKHISHYTLLNPFRHEPLFQAKEEKDVLETLEEKLEAVSAQQGATAKETLQNSTEHRTR